MRLKSTYYTFEISIPKDFDFVSRWFGSSWLRKVAKIVTIEEIANYKCVGDSLCLNNPTNFNLSGKHRLCWLHGVNTIHIIAKLRGKKSLYHTDFFNAKKIY